MLRHEWSETGEYEGGAYDVRSPEPRPTALVALSRRLSQGDAALPLAAQGIGWWRSNSRLTYAIERAEEQATRPSAAQYFPGTLIVRSGFSLDPERANDPMLRILTLLGRGQVIRMPHDEIVSPSWTPHLIHAALDLSIDGERGIWHLVPRAACSTRYLVRRFAECVGVPFTVDVTGTPARSARGPMRALGSERGWPLPELEATIEVALERYCERFGAGAAMAELTA